MSGKTVGKLSGCQEHPLLKGMHKSLNMLVNWNIDKELWLTIWLHSDRDALLHAAGCTVSPRVHVHLASRLAHHLALERVAVPRVPPEEGLAPLARERPVVHPVGLVAAHHADEIRRVRAH